MSIPDPHRASREPAATRIFTLIRDRILSGSLPAGDHMSPAQQIARETNVSRAAVKNALDQLVAEGYLRRIARGAGRSAAAALYM